MAITFNTNLAALGAQRNIGIASAAASSSLSKLSSGSRVPQAKDDAAGLAIGSKLKSEVAGLTQASNNAAQAVSLLQIADGAMSTLGDVLQRMKALAVQSSSGQLADADRSLLNQEFTSLRSEVDRVSALTNFNGTSLLAGSTIVASNKNNLAAFSATNNSAATNLIGEGFDTVTFASNYGSGGIKVAYDSTNRNMTVTDLVNNKTQTIQLNAGAITAGSTEEYNFGNIGVKIALNSNFNKATTIAAADSVGITPGFARVELTSAVVSLGLTGVTNTVDTLSALSLAGTGVNALTADQLYGASITMTGVAATVLAGNFTITAANGVKHTFVNTTGTQSFAAAGTKSYNYDDGLGNTFTLQVVSTGAGSGSASSSISFDSYANQGTAGKIEATGTGANAPSLISLVEGGTTTFDFGNVDNAVVAFNAATASTTSATITLNGTAFSTANAGGATADLTSTGIKTLTLADTNGNKFTIQFNVTQAFTNGDTGNFTVAQFGQVIGAASATSGSTTFAFKVGTGSTSNDNISFTLNSTTTTALGVNASTIDTSTNANTAITALNAAITSISSRRADIGAAQSRLDFASNNISVAIQNTTAAESALLDVDVSSEITKFTNQNVLMQAGISLLGQANQQPALLLRLLQ